MESQTPTKPIETKKVPTMEEFRGEKKKKFTLQNIIIGFVFVCAFIAAMKGHLASVPLTGLAIWMEMTRD